MTQAFNLSQLANNVNTSGLLNAAAGLYNQTPVANGGTGKASVTSGTLLLGAGTSAMTELAGAATNDVVTWNGTAWASAVPQGGALQTFTVAITPGTWTKPATVKGIKVTVIGGGGNGGAGVSNPGPGTPGTPTTGGAGGGGGGGGSAVRLYPAPSLPGPQPYTVGTATLSSSFGIAPATVITATGGSSGGASSGTNNSGGAGGTGSNGQLNVTGGGGGFGLVNSFSSAGGSSLLGFGAGLIAPNVAGGAGSGYGGGGGGGSVNPSPGLAPAGNKAGGSGTAGVVIIEEFY
jgi:hypothetical protein